MKKTARKIESGVRFAASQNTMFSAPLRHAPVGVHSRSFPKSAIVIVEVERQKKHVIQLNRAEIGSEVVFTKKGEFSESKAEVQRLGTLGYKI